MQEVNSSVTVVVLSYVCLWEERMGNPVCFDRREDKSPALLTLSCIILSFYLSFVVFMWFCSREWIFISRVSAEVNEPFELQ